MKLRKRLEHFLKYVDESTNWKEDNDVPNHVIVHAYLGKFKPNGQLPGIGSKPDLAYVREIEERIIWRLQTEFKEHHDLVQQIVADNFENIYKRFQACDSEKGGEKRVCGDCGCSLTKVMDGKYQCDNMNCISKIGA